MSNEELKLNDISRFSKSSPRLILREYNNCEVPAGCGGVVFRWDKRDNPVNFEMLLFTPGDFTLYIDDNIPQSACPLLERGDHILSIVISNFTSNYGLLLFAGRSGEANIYREDVSFSEGIEKQRVLSLADSSWKYLLSEPKDESWKTQNYNDSNWKSMIAKDIFPIEEQDALYYFTQKLSSLGAQSLGIQETTDITIWIRKKFSL